jgi:hypothetical protein
MLSEHLGFSKGGVKMFAVETLGVVSAKSVQM